MKSIDEISEKGGGPKLGGPLFIPLPHPLKSVINQSCERRERRSPSKVQRQSHNSHSAQT